MEKITGEFKPKEKINEFIGSKGSVNFISDEAIIEGKQLSGLEMDDLKFKMTIYKDGTVDLDDIDGQETPKEKRMNLLDIIFDKTIVSFRKRMVINELTFESVKEVEGKKIPLYLSVEYTKPIDKLRSIFEEEDGDLDIEVSETQLSKLMSFLDDEDDEVVVTKDVKVEEKVVEKVDFDYNKHMEDSFNEMLKSKVIDLKNNITQKEKELVEFEKEIIITNSKIEGIKSEIELLKSRLDSLQPIADFNGYYFNVSEILNEKVELDENTFDLIKSKVSKIKSINLDAFMKLFTNGEFKIRLAKKSNGEFIEVNDFKSLPEEIINSFKPLNVVISDGDLYYNGDLAWAVIVNMLIKEGFHQDPEWDKICGSNSYKNQDDI